MESKKICPYCNKEVLGSILYCSECGQPITNQQINKSSSSEDYWGEYRKEKEAIEHEKNVQRELQRKERVFKQKVIITSISIIGVVVLIFVYILKIMPAQNYEKANELFNEGHYVEARSAFENLGDYKDALPMVEMCKYKQAIVEYENENYKEALLEFNSFIEYEDSRNFAGLCELELLQSANNNDTVMLGNYEGNAIEWIILSKSDSEILLISKYYITTKVANENEYGKNGKYKCWSESTLRTWLNTQFVSMVFSSEVGKLLLLNDITTNEYDVRNYDGGDEVEIVVSTKDKVYIPSIADVEKYSIEPTSRLGSYDDAMIAGWLRDCGHGIAFQSTHEADGSFGSEWHWYKELGHTGQGVRPIIRISLDY